MSHVDYRVFALACSTELYYGLVNPRDWAMTAADEKRVHRLAERKSFRLDKVGKGQHRFYIINVESGGRMPSGVSDHEYSLSLEQAEAWLASVDTRPKGT